MRNEPAIIIGAIEAAFLAFVPALAYAFGWSPEAVALIAGVVGPIIAVLSAVVVRSKVTPA